MPVSFPQILLSHPSQNSRIPVVYLSNIRSSNLIVKSPTGPLKKKYFKKLSANNPETSSYNMQRSLIKRKATSTSSLTSLQPLPFIYPKKKLKIYKSYAQIKLSTIDEQLQTMQSYEKRSIAANLRYKSLKCLMRK